ncbi:MAG: serine hydrolase domain-containing protein [Ekhidna sp.]
MKRIFLITLASLFISHFGNSQNYADSTFTQQIHAARELILKLKEDQKIPGISIAVGKAGQTIWKEGIGFADIKNETAVTTSTKFRIASISKTLTALAIGKLYDEGELEWSDPVNKHLSIGEATNSSYTIRQLAGHQSGIRHYKGFEFYSNKQYNSVEESLDPFRDDKLLFEPGAEYKYTTYGYTVLGRLIEVLSGQSYAAYMSTEVLKVLGMKNTVLADGGFDESGVATFYSKGGKRETREVNLSVKWPGGGFLSTPSDLVSMVNRAGKIISFSTLQDLITPQKLPDGSTTGYGMGFRISQVQSTGQLIVHHGGRIVGARSFLLALPDQQIVIAICTNTEADYGVNEVYEIAKLFQN